jgi:hypothetical protein
MAGKRIGSDLAGVCAKVLPKNSFNLPIFDFAAFDSRKHAAGILRRHLLELAIAATETVEGDALKKHVALFIDVEVRKHATISKAHAEPTRPRRHRWVDLDVK